MLRRWKITSPRVGRIIQMNYSHATGSMGMSGSDFANIDRQHAPFDPVRDTTVRIEARRKVRLSPAPAPTPVP